jgi:hypothetical protein
MAKKRKKRKPKAQVFSLDAHRKAKQESVEMVLFEADKPDLMGVSFTKHELITRVLPRTLQKPQVEDAWMDGDKLVVRMKRTQTG